ncbi:organic solvent tolerance protein OstA [Candidatus Scalindua japonica]|uniref:Organic solvent tolerance protein OstA n=1 Tax=Candidatus Scalindua japonica TaxID=1284222 RepID=A0A286U2T7_9BACT|nr:hypothetical protein [Candidatus Scalindua japonica]GAX62453.1 organic solvent tolerance protein OstA [Candidatus Scalindua japonica]
MKKTIQICIVLLYLFVLTTSAGSFVNRAYGEDSVEKHGTEATKIVMHAIGASMTKILEGILNADFDIVFKESNRISRISVDMVHLFFPDDKWGLEGRKFKMSDNTMRNKYEKYTKKLAADSKKLAEISKNMDSMETYEFFDTMLRNICFACHIDSRGDWPVP